MRHKFAVGAVAVAFALSAVPSLAQEKQAGSRPAGGAERTGSAAPRGGATGSGSGGAVSRGGGSSGGGMSGGSMGSSSSPSMPSSSGFGASGRSSADRAPRRSDDQATGRRAVPRGSSAASGGSTSRSAGANGSGNRVNNSGSTRRAVPAHSRPRDGRPSSGVAVDRRSLPPTIGNDIFFIYRPYYYPYGFWGSNYGFGLGYLYYDPFWYGGYGYGGGGYSSPGYYSSGGYSQSYRDTGNLRLKIKPRDAQVFVDGYFVGVVDSFDGTFQRLMLDGGGHRVEIKADGYEPVEFEVLITPGETVTYKGDLKRMQ